jgi:hypothetical protein
MKQSEYIELLEDWNLNCPSFMRVAGSFTSSPNLYKIINKPLKKETNSTVQAPFFRSLQSFSWTRNCSPYMELEDHDTYYRLESNIM